MEVVVKKSKIHGKGIFANRDFKKGETVLRWDLTHLLTEKEAKKLPDFEKDYLSRIGGKIIHIQPPERFVNHSCDNNTEVRGFCDVAVKSIKKGEEITSDYSSTISKDSNAKCSCSSPKCTGFIKRKK